MANRLQQASRLLKSSDPKDRHAGSGLLHRLKSKTAVRLKLQALEDKEPSVRLSAVVGLFFPPEEAVDPLSRHLLSDPNERVREICGCALGTLENPDLVDVFRQALSDSNENIHLLACVSLYELDEHEPLLSAIHHPSPLIRLQACENLITRWKAPSEEIIATLETLTVQPVGKEHDERVAGHRAALQEAIDQGWVDRKELAKHEEAHREWTVAELIEEAKSLMA